jgi:hypothetical protein
MTEEFLHYIWMFRRYDPELTLISGEHLIVLDPGIHNSDSGPDFFNARIRIGKTLWAGNVEIHVNGSDWMRHGHHTDSAYNSVILHVVWNSDTLVKRSNGLALPVLELNGKFPESLWKTYLGFLSSRQWIPCEALLRHTDSLRVHAWLDRLLVSRLERKSAAVEEALAFSEKDWTQTFYRLLATQLGFKLNNLAFAMLAQSLPYPLLARHADDLFQVEALIFGQAGMLEADFHDDYPNRLRKEYKHLRHKFGLKPIDAHLWKFMRLHPGNFPTLRLAQFASILHRTGSSADLLFEAGDRAVYLGLFSSEASEYWTTHYLFDKPSAPRRKSLGSASADLLLINLVAPLLLTYGKRKHEPAFTERALDLLMQIKGEDNSIIRHWASLGMDVSSAAFTQALLELKTSYCDRKKCLECLIGSELMKPC